MNMYMVNERRKYTRPETEVVPCEMRPVMEPSIHARGSNWLDGGTEELGFSEYDRPSGFSAGSFRFKSVWDATAKEIQNGELVVVPTE